MKIAYIDIQNYRKLKNSRLKLTTKETLLVGANNSGKTSAMDALILFLDQKSKNVSPFGGEITQKRKLTATDFTLSNWNDLNEFGRSWLFETPANGNKLTDWQPYCPSLDVWLEVGRDEVHRVSHLIPTLKWEGGLLGVRLIFQPKDLDALIADFIACYKSAENLISSIPASVSLTTEAEIEENKFKLTIWPQNLRDYFEKEISGNFELKAYILDPKKFSPSAKTKPQVLDSDNEPLESYPFNGLFKVDIIDASRGFSDPYSVMGQGQTSTSNLASQINKYYNRHLNPSDLPGLDDLSALEAIGRAQHSFDERLNDVFKTPLEEIKNLGYPGFNDPQIRLSSKVNPIDNLDHEAAILFDIQKNLSSLNEPVLSLSEKYNGLGFKNLIAIIFKLMSYRDHWMRVGKAGKKTFEDSDFIEPLHLVLIEEPEAHLHAQVQQVFIRKAYGVLRNHNDLGGLTTFETQMVVSTHSSYIAHEIGFEKLRYFKRKPAITSRDVPTAEVIDLSDTFGLAKDPETDIYQTAQFVARYLKTTHCDLFFANGVILVEGAAERLLIPHFIRNHKNKETSLESSYISILEVGGAHAHRLKALIDKLGLPTLVITDTDATEPSAPGTNDKPKAIRPKRNMGYKTGSNTLKKWLAVKDDSLDAVLDLPSKDKAIGNVRAAYQCGIDIDFDGNGSCEAIPYTFEDAIALSNPNFIRNIKNPTGMIRKMQAALNMSDLESCCNSLYKALADDKAGMAMDLMFCSDPDMLYAPKYVQEGLDWLKEKLDAASEDLIPSIIDLQEDK